MSDHLLCTRMCRDEQGALIYPSPILIAIRLVLVELCNKNSLGTCLFANWVIRGPNVKRICFLSNGLACILTSQHEYLEHARIP